MTVNLIGQLDNSTLISLFCLKFEILPPKQFKQSWKNVDVLLYNSINTRITAYFLTDVNWCLYKHLSDLPGIFSEIQNSNKVLHNVT